MSQIPSNKHQAQPVRREVINDLVSGGLCLAISISLAVVHFSQTGRLHDDFNRDPGPAMLPVILLIALAGAGAGLSLRGWLALPKTQATDRTSIAMGWPAVAAIVLMAAFLPVRTAIGSAAALALIGAFLAVLAGRDDGARWQLTAGMGALIGFALYCLFHFGLSIPL
ncbi:MAG: tripartite tricarboxylate transporter TctB family protein [Yoonia sp.]|uniref:tripartite tricarboxylate transporter TctB family protein n=1 Tax=Yoonia sp. TaxID=2212373 RepID=UPI003EF894C5